ncbi:MAG: tRNA uridine-5-carboxymethylaminomethyl(34) synthesis GTPase MnmE [Chitinispirillia bacterium]|nr:tRNA uridine-5-carboxymethylaminomethyl(34) synthesis GTPase MnmE [Chitinispirillia bacterium]
MDASTHTIAALSTPQGRGALAVIRLTGEGSQSVFAAIIRESVRFKKEIARKIGVYSVLNDCHPYSYSCVENGRADGFDGQIGVGSDNPAPNYPCNTHVGATAPGRPPSVDDTNIPDIIDEVTAIKYDAPRSFTGEEMVEIFCHGGTAVTAKILDRLFKKGARPAGRGEFSRRAFVNGKIGLLKAESIAGLIESQTEMRLQSAQLAYQGKQLESLERLKRRIINILSDIESRIEFGEDDDVAESKAGLISTNRIDLGTIISELEEEVRRGERVKAFDDGVAVALAGPANAGKSSLFNEILGYDRSIVHDRPGTTRDIVSERIVFEGTTVKLFDSAGIRDTSDIVEKQGIERTMAAVRWAHIVLWVTAADEELGHDERAGILEITNKTDAPDMPNSLQNRAKKNVLVVINKVDMASPESKKNFCRKLSLNCVEASLTEKINTEKLFEAIGAAIRAVTSDICAPEIIVNERHRDIIQSVIEDLRHGVDNFDREEVAAHYLRLALSRLEEFCGHVAGDEILDGIFGKFCIGK